MARLRAVVVGDDVAGGIVKEVEEWDRDKYFFRVVVGMGEGKEDLETFFTRNWEYVGVRELAEWMAREQIRPEASEKGKTICSVGFSVPKNCWMGYSHRGHAFFPVGSKLDLEDHVLVKYKGYPFGYVIQDLEDSRRAACDFADEIA